MNNLNIKYNGKVTVKYEKNGKILKSYQIHNNGTNELFRYLCDCLTNNQINHVRDCPEFIMLYQLQTGEPSESNLGDPALNAVQPKSKVETIIDDNTYKTKFRFIIPTNALIVDDEINVIAIYSYNNQGTATVSTRKPSAYTKLINSEGGAITISKNIGNNILIDWEMSFENGGNE